jgi:hypothetical protein
MLKLDILISSLSRRTLVKEKSVWILARQVHDEDGSKIFYI